MDNLAEGRLKSIGNINYDGVKKFSRKQGAVAEIPT